MLGFAGGAAGTLAMRAYWRAVTALKGRDPRKETTRGEHALDEIAVVGRQHQPGESSTAAAGRIGYETLTDTEPQAKETKTILSYLVHWAYGSLQGGVYGAVRGRAPLPDVPGGIAFGTALWILGDEVAVPLLGLSEGPTAFPLNQHIHRFGAHMAYGLSATTVTQLLYRLF
ncbi:MAG: hypothetical protein KatS3mg057_0773 [Herpetosiphonaceae bacterium]|nr:MAG: hypothetical protein KatS3mg057_0773 [Herpetosiphonaceae bacterium]